MERIKQVILVRRDLKMRRGKEIAQGSHASAEFLLDQVRAKLQANAEAPIAIDLTPEEKSWIIHGIAKVCLRVDSEAELLEYHQKALAAGLKSHIIQDSGRTEFHGQPTLTACAIGPAEVSKIDAVTGNLVPY